MWVSSIRYGPDTYMGENLHSMLSRVAKLPDQQVRETRGRRGHRKKASRGVGVGRHSGRDTRTEREGYKKRERAELGGVGQRERESNERE